MDCDIWCPKIKALLPAFRIAMMNCGRRTTGIAQGITWQTDNDIPTVEQWVPFWSEVILKSQTIFNENAICLYLGN